MWIVDVSLTSKHPTRFFHLSMSWMSQGQIVTIYCRTGRSRTSCLRLSTSVAFSQGLVVVQPPTACLATFTKSCAFLVALGSALSSFARSSKASPVFFNSLSLPLQRHTDRHFIFTAEKFRGLEACQAHWNCLQLARLTSTCSLKNVSGEGGAINAATGSVAEDLGSESGHSNMIAFAFCMTPGSKQPSHDLVRG